MASTETMVAHCGACVGVMGLEQEGETGPFRFVCQRCGYETPWRGTTAAAGEDVVWQRMTATDKRMGLGSTKGAKAHEKHERGTAIKRERL